VLARRERVDALRPFAFEDTDQDAGPRAEPHRPRPPPLPRPSAALPNNSARPWARCAA
jgi:hypothetical protein